MRSIRRRRHEAKTDYKTRLALLTSHKPRLVVRKTNRYLIAQIVTSAHAQDCVIAGITSKALFAKGWPEGAAGSLKSKPAAYLTGFLIGKRAKDSIKEAILDSGMQRNIQKSRIYALVKGARDAGLHIPCSDDVLPGIQEFSNHKKLGSIFDTVKQKL